VTGVTTHFAYLIINEKVIIKFKITMIEDVNEIIEEDVGFTNINVHKTNFLQRIKFSTLNILDLSSLGVKFNRWNIIELRTKIPKQEFLYAIKFVLNSIYFKFNDKIYKQ